MLGAGVYQIDEFLLGMYAQLAVAVLDVRLNGVYRYALHLCNALVCIAPI